ncbi:MAG: hypothetical protein ACYDEQ_10415, partial [Desulfocucumaceae bacterium]
ACYVPDVFINDCLRNGIDPYNKSVKAVNGGNYGVDYTINLDINGPAALVAQGSVKPGSENEVDMYNQLLTFRLDGVVRTIQIMDPNYQEFYSNRSALRPQGYGQVIAVFPDRGSHRHVLHFSLPPNGYGPVKFYLLPM